MGSNPRESLLLRFAAEAGDAGDPGATEDAVRVEIVTELRGVFTRALSGCKRCATLLVDFAVGVSELCARALFQGISPTGHAPLVLDEVDCGRSTCGYLGPQSATAFWAYSEPADPNDEGFLLAIDWPSANLYAYFDWPAPVIAFDPPLEDGELPPPLALELASFDSLNTYSSDGVQLPMRLVATPAGQSLPETLLLERVEGEAPGFTGSAWTVRCAVSEVWELTGKALVDALGRGDWDLYWRIYKGDGDMVYRATCSGSQLGELYRDRRQAGLGGGLGAFLTTDLLAARVHVEPEPYPWEVELAATGARYGLSPDGALREPPDLPVYLTDPMERTWVSEDGFALSWQGAEIHVAGRLWTTAPGSIYCAAVLSDLAAQPVLQVLTTGSVTRELRLWRLPLVVGSTWELTATTTSPVLIAPNRATLTPGTYRFSPTGVQVLAYGVGGRTMNWLCPLTDVTSEFRSGMQPGCVWRTAVRDFPVQDPSTGEWVLVWAFDAWTKVSEHDFLHSIAYTEQQIDGYMQTTMRCESLVCAFWDDETLVVRTAAAEADSHAERCDLIVYDNGDERLRYAIDDGSQLPRRLVFLQTWPDKDLVHAVLECPRVDAVRRDYRLRVLRGTEELAALPCAPEHGGYQPRLTFSPFFSWYDFHATDEALMRTSWALTEEGYCVPHSFLSICEWYPWPYDAAYFSSDPPMLARDALQTAIKSRGAGVWFDAAAVGDLTTVTAGIHMDYEILTLPRYTYGLVTLVGDGAAAPAPPLDAPFADIPTVRRLSPRACLFAPAPRAADGGGTPAEPPTAQAILEAHNALRAAEGLSALTLDSALTAAAAVHCAWLASAGVVTHTGPGGTQPIDRAQAQGYDGATMLRVAENLAALQTDLDDVMPDWMTSPGHRANILDPGWLHLGCYVMGWPGGGFVWVVEFGTHD